MLAPSSAPMLPPNAVPTKSILKFHPESWNTLLNFFPLLHKSKEPTSHQFNFTDLQLFIFIPIHLYKNDKGRLRENFYSVTFSFALSS